MNQPELAELSPNQIVPALADRGTYLCSPATMYRVLKEEKQLSHRSRSAERREPRPAKRVAAKAAYPERWCSRPTRGWSQPKRVLVRAR